jgi:UDP-2,4-diacetamido-2,4,6-trideoxy-beta-L-altropyranose hydrolase
MRVIFRTDASSQIGTGHFMRCLTLAEELKKQGADISFISRNLPIHLSDMLNAKSIKLIPLSSDDADEPIDELAHASWLGISQAEDAKATIEALFGEIFDWMIVDHYALDVRWESIVRPNFKKIMVIDDLADRQHDCDILLDQNYYADMQTRYNGKVPSYCKLLLGPNYALLREEFRVLRDQAKVRNGEVEKVLVFFGGVDANNLTSKAIEALAEVNTGLKVNVVIGAQHPFKELIENACENYGYVCHVQTSYMAGLMAEADLAIGAGGSATWERCYLGLPTLTLCLAENQLRQILDAAEIGVLYAPKMGNDLTNSLKFHIKALFANPALIKLISNASMKLIDGEGVFSIIKELYSGLDDLMAAKNFEVRRASHNDGIKVWPWRNNENTRKYFFNKSRLNFDEHIQWWNQSLADSNRLLLLGSLNNIDFGVIRFDFIDKDNVVASVYFNPIMAGKRLGRPMLIKSLTWLKDNYPEFKTVAAEIIPENVASTRLFESVGFKEAYKVFRLELSK